MLRCLATVGVALVSYAAIAENDFDVYDAVEHHNVDNDGVNIHYVTLGESPVVLFEHGFPNWWYDWRNQMAALSDTYKSVAMDTRGYNKSGKPEGKENYTFPHFSSDVEAVFDDLGEQSVTLAGHDWGAGISWRFAAHQPERVNRLIIINLTHPTAYMKVRETGAPEQLASMDYIRRIYESTEAPPMLTNAEARVNQMRGSDELKARYLELHLESLHTGHIAGHRP